LIQIGGLGILTALFGIGMFAHKKVGLANSLLLKDALNINTMSDLGPFVKRIIAWTFIIEGIGAALYMPVFIKDFGWRGIWISIFNAVSAFCNAGLDIIGNDSLCGYVNNYWVNFVTCALIVLGGIGYIVWIDVATNIKNRKNKSVRWRNFNLNTKIAIVSTLVLIFGGAALFLVFDYNNPLTLGNMNFFEKINASVFQSITCRTAGFVTIPQENFTNPSALISLLLMFIGGSPVGTAGGVKTVTTIVLLSSAISTIRNKSDVEIMHRRIDKNTVNKSVAVVCVSFSITLLSTLLLSTCIDAPFLSILHECVSATATVGTSMNLTGQLGLFGKLVVICTMYLGRVGPISLVVAFSTSKENKNIVKNPVESISVG
jgi:trk system potassium uptake protein TrkH